MTPTVLTVSPSPSIIPMVSCHILSSLYRAHDRVRELGLVLDRDLARSVAHDLDVALELVHALGGFRDLAGRLGFAREVAHELDLAIARNPIRGRRIVLDLVQRVDGALLLAAELDDAVAGVTRDPLPSFGISSLAARTAGWAVWLLPPAARSRYAEEYKAELYELARRSRQAQWAYAARLVCCAPRQRRELRLAAREAVQG